MVHHLEMSCTETGRRDVWAPQQSVPQTTATAVSPPFLFISFHLRSSCLFYTRHVHHDFRETLSTAEETGRFDSREANFFHFFSFSQGKGK